MKPHLLLDIDGVLCPFGRDFEPEGFKTYEFEKYNRTYTVYFSEENQKRIQTLSQYYQISWATMWHDLANEHRHIFGIDEALPVIEFDYNLSNRYELAEGEPDVAYRLSGHSLDPGLTTLKYPYLYQWAKHGEPFAWIDDIIGDDVRAWVENLDQPTLLIEPDHHIGMTDNHYEELLSFAKRLENDKE